MISKKAIDELHMKDKCIVCSSSIDISTDLVSMNYLKSERDHIYKSILNERKSNKKDKLLGKKRTIDDRIQRVTENSKKIKI